MDYDTLLDREERTARVDKIIDRAILGEDAQALGDMLDCHRYTATGDLRALQGLGWHPQALTFPQLRRIHAALEEL